MPSLGEYVSAEPPNLLEKKRQYCCLRCRLVKTLAQFHDKGCDNCPGLRGLPQGELEAHYVSKKWDGILAVMDPDDSWAHKWVRLGKRIVPGVYAMRCREEYIAP